MPQSPDVARTQTVQEAKVLERGAKFEDLSAEGRVRLALAASYRDLARGQAWDAVVKGLEEAGVKPIEADNIILREQLEDLGLKVEEVRAAVWTVNSCLVKWGECRSSGCKRT